MYGNTTASDGQSLENNFVPVITGLHVKENQILSLKMFEDENGVVDTRRANLIIKQSNGAELRHTIWDGLKNGQVDEKSVDRLNGFMLHLGTVLLGGSQDAYKTAIGSPANFTEFINNFNANIVAKSTTKRFTMTIIKRENQSNGKWYAQVPMFPNFIEVDGTAPSTLFMKKSYIFDEPEVTAPANASTGSDVADAF